MIVLTDPWCLEQMSGWLASAPPGAVVEVGVYEGGSLAYLASRHPDRPCYGYDTFLGLPEHDPERDNYHRRGDFTASERVVRRDLAYLPNVTLIAGSYPASDTLRPTPIALAHVDVDLYRPTLGALRHLWPLMVPGGRIYCNDAFYESCEGATQALMEFVTALEITCESESDPSGRPHAYIVKPGAERA